MISRIVIFATVVVLVALLIWLRRRSARHKDHFIGDEYDSDYSDFGEDDSGGDDFGGDES